MEKKGVAKLTQLTMQPPNGNKADPGFFDQAAKRELVKKLTAMNEEAFNNVRPTRSL